MFPFFCRSICALQITWLSFSFVCLTSSMRSGNVESLSGTVHKLTNNHSNETRNQKNNKLDHNVIFFSKKSIFPCLDNLELNYFNLSRPLADHRHLMRIYHSNDLNQNRSTQSTNSSNDHKVNGLIKDSNDQLTYVREFIINVPLINSKIVIHCNLFDPVYLLYCFRYVSIDVTSGKIRFESDLHCLSTLEQNGKSMSEHYDEQNAELSTIKLNSSDYSGGSRYGSSLKLYDEQVDELDDRMLSNLNKSNRHVQQTKQTIVCSCGKRTLLNRTVHLIQLTSGNGYCRNGLFNSTDSKTLIKIKRLDFEYCFIEFNSPTWIEIRVRDALLLNKKEQDFKQQFTIRQSFSSNGDLIIRDGKTYIAPQLNYFQSFPTFHYINSGILRFESKSLGNQYTIELNCLNEKIDLLSRSDHQATDLQVNADERSSNRLEMEKRNRFLIDRKLKLANTEQSLKAFTNQTDNKILLKGKLNQISSIEHIELSPHKVKFKQNENEENLLVLLIDQNGQNLIVDNQLNFDKKINQFHLNEFNRLDRSNYERLEYDSQLFTYELKAKLFVLKLIALIVFVLIAVSFITFAFIFTKTKIRPPTGNLIRFGLSDDNILLSNDYQEVKLNSRSNPNAKLNRIDEEAIYESCKTRNSNSSQNTSDESSSENDDLLDESDDDESEIETQSVRNELGDLSKQSSDEFSNAETLKNESTFFTSSFIKDDFHELNKKRKMFKNCLNNCDSKDDVSNGAVGRLSQCSFPTSEISLELDYYDYLTPFVPKPPIHNNR